MYLKKLSFNLFLRQAAATTNYAVTLIHEPTKVFVRCEESRSVEKNRIKAKEKLLEALDFHINKEESVVAQVKRIEKFRKERTDEKRKQKREERLRAKSEKELLKEEEEESSEPEVQTVESSTSKIEEKTKESDSKVD